MLSAPRRLRCNFTDLPLAVSDATPHLSWWASDTRPAELQSAYEIVAASTHHVRIHQLQKQIREVRLTIRLGQRKLKLAVKLLRQVGQLPLFWRV